MSSIETSKNDNTDIHIPTSLPMILKQFCKAAIRTQPYDLLKWSSAYFRALADGEEPPTKLRLEYPAFCTPTGLTLGFLKVLLRQLGDYNKFVPLETILRKWDCLCLNREDLNLITMIGKFHNKCQVKKFLAIAVGLMTSSLSETMIMICELFTHEPDGGSAMIPVTLFMEIYGYLAGLKCDGSKMESDDEEGSTMNTKDSEEVSDAIHKHLERDISLTSQDTEADVNSELESIPKDEPEVLKNEVAELKKQNPNLVEDLSEKEDTSLNIEALKLENTTKSLESVSDQKVPELTTSESTRNDEFAGERPTTSGSKELSRDDQQRSNSKRSQSNSAKRKSEHNLKPLKFYPNVPGIGPQLVAAEVASVAVWMTECARRQHGMVGPRNLRHPHCPSLDRQNSI